MEDSSIVGKIKDRKGNEYDVRFFPVSQDFPDCHIITHNRIEVGITTKCEVVRITKEIWENIGIRMGWKRRKHGVM